MLELVTIDDAKAQLQLDDDAYNAWLAIAIPGVSDAVALWLKDSWRLYLLETDASGNIVEDSSGEPIPQEDSSGPIVHPAVRLATLIELASQRRFIEGDGDNAVPPDAGHGYVLCRGATQLLVALRKSTVA